jgi:hypothetical protein
MARTKDGFPPAPRTPLALNQRARGMTFLRESTPRMGKKCSGVSLPADPICKNGKWRDKEER